MIEDYFQPDTLEGALSLLRQYKGQVLVIAGGTDLLLKQIKETTANIVLVDINKIPELMEISSSEQGVRIGAACSLAEIVNSSFMTVNLNVLSSGASIVGSPQIRNLATIGGNLCNAAPSADSAPPLLVLDAQMELASLQERRQVSLASFFLGPGLTTLKADELLTTILIPPQASNAKAVFLRHAPRRAMDLAIASVAVQLWYADDQIQGRIALGAVAPTPIRAAQAEALLLSKPTPDESTFRAVAHCAAEEAAPISDVRASAGHRRKMVEVLTFRALRQASIQLQPVVG